MWVYETEHFKQQVELYGLGEHVESANERIRSQTSRYDVINLFGKNNGYSKDWAESNNLVLRLIGKVLRTHDDHVFVWFNIFERKDHEYENFAKQSESMIQRGFRIDDFDNWYRQRTEQEVAHNRPTPLPDSMYPWLHSPLRNALVASVDGKELFVFESDAWVKNIRSVGQNDMNSFRRTVEMIVESAEQDSDFGYAEPFSVLASNDDGTGAIAFRRIDASTILLLAPLKSDRNITEKDVPKIGPDWKKSARRGYPAYVSLDKDMWLDVQEEEQANLALSPEEEKLLADVAGRGSATQPLPLFINGSAGSGKSTMLAYIFAALCRAKDGEIESGELEGVPLFLTYSEALVDAARRMTDRLLSRNVLLQKNLSFSTENLFQNWRSFMVSLLPDDQRGRFRDDHRVGFHQFKLAFHGKHDRLRPFIGTAKKNSEITAELAWYVIRSLIKGSAPAGSVELTPDDYKEMNQKDRVVSDEIFAEVHRNVYMSWYAAALRDDSLWDDQDLVSQVLKSPHTRPPQGDIVALVIDEAQDFTRRELRLIARTSVFRRFAINPFPPVALPIVFAGDPMQSLSPTGFRWDAVKATIYEELESICDNASQPKFEQLSNNYRSTSQIVGFANAIQLIRSERFDIPGTTLQRAWDDISESVAPGKYVIGSPQLSEKKFMEFASQTIIIVPCEEGGEVHFVKNDATLSKMFPDVSDSDPAGNVYSASGAKGLEFERVILYKFGESAPTNSRPGQDERDLAAEYFFNKLYVAATRATKFLTVVDTQTGDDQLWSSMMHDPIKDLVLSLDDGKRRAYGLEPAELTSLDAHIEFAAAKGLEESIESIDDQRLLKEDNPLRYAELIMDQAVDTRNSMMLRQAKSYYRQLGHPDRASLCEAYALKFEGKRVDAAREFLAASVPDEAFECYWAEGRFDQLANENAQIFAGVPKTPIQTMAIAYMVAEAKYSESPFITSTAFDDLARVLAEAPSLPRPSQEQWENIVESFRANALPWAHDQDRDSVSKAAELFLNLARSGYAGCAATAAELFMQCEQFTTAETIWTNYNISLPANHARRFAKDSGYPSGLRYLQNAELHEDVVTIWKQAGMPGAPGWTSVVLLSLEKLNDLSALIDLHLAMGDVAEAGRSVLSNLSSRPQLQDRIEDVVKAYGKELNVRDAVRFVNDVAEKRVRISTARLKAELIKLIVNENIALGWPALPEFHRAPFLELMQSTRDWGENQRIQVPELVWGAAHELARDFNTAQRVYTRLLDSQSKFIRTQSRTRWLACARELNQPTAGKGRDWGINPARLPIVPVVEAQVRRQTGKEAATNGSRDNLLWMIANGQLTITVTGDSPAMCLVDLADFSVKLATGASLEIEVADNASATFTFGDWEINVDRERSTLVTTDKFGVSVEETVLMSIPGGAPTRKTAAKEAGLPDIPAPMKVADFKKKYGLKTVEFERLCKRASVKSRGAAMTLNVKEVELLLETMQEEEKKRREKRNNDDNTSTEEPDA